MSSGQYDNEMRGALFANDRKGNDKAPNAKGRIQIKGVVYFLSAWTKTDRNGNRYQSIEAEVAPERFQPTPPAPPQAAAPVAAPPVAASGYQMPSEEDIPF